MTTQPRTTGTATSRLAKARRGTRRRTKARLALSGPSGAGKTWTALSVAQVIGAERSEDGRVIRPASVLVIDTEPGDGNQGASELYADAFDFDVIEWLAPYDPRDLALTIRDAGTQYDVIIVDSASHFWKGQGGTLDIAGGRFGGWKAATPAQDELVDAILRCAAHVIVCTRAKQDYQVEEDPNGKQTVKKLGLAPIQRDDLEYEFQVVAMIDVEHRLDVGKTRAAVLAGRSYPPGQQDRMAEEYREWLEAGVQFIRLSDVEALRSGFDSLDNEQERRKLKTMFRSEFGDPTQLSEDRLPSVWAWLSGQLGMEVHRPVNVGDDGRCGFCLALTAAGWHDPTGPEPTPPAHPTDPEPVEDPAPGPMAATDGMTEDDLAAADLAGEVPERDEPACGLCEGYGYLIEEAPPCNIPDGVGSGAVLRCEQCNRFATEEDAAAAAVLDAPDGWALSVINFGTDADIHVIYDAEALAAHRPQEARDGAGMENHPQEPVNGPESGTEPLPPAVHEDDVAGIVGMMAKRECVEALRSRGLPTSGNLDALRSRLIDGWNAPTSG